MLLVTRPGNFYPGDILGTAIISLLYGEELDIIRSNQTSDIRRADYVVGIGEVYDKLNNRFDHHQQGFSYTRRDSEIRYSTFGLVWKEYGEKLCPSKREENYVDRYLVQPVDAAENKQLTYKKLPGIVPVTITTLFGAFNPTWVDSDMSADTAFFDALGFGEAIIENSIRAAISEVKAYDYIQAKVFEAQDERILILDRNVPWHRYVPWHMAPIFVVEPKHDKFAVCSISEKVGVFSPRKMFPASWSSLKGIRLEKVCGVAGASFCNRNVTYVINDTLEGAIKMAEIALASESTNVFSENRIHSPSGYFAEDEPPCGA